MECWSGCIFYIWYTTYSTQPIHYGFKKSVCITDTKYDPHINLWCVFFIFSKIIELGYTAFIVLCKSSHLDFLHWYHHMTILLILLLSSRYGYNQNGPNTT